jgi:hypothetical protein
MAMRSTPVSIEEGKRIRSTSSGAQCVADPA